MVKLFSFLTAKPFSVTLFNAQNWRIQLVVKLNVLDGHLVSL